MLKLSIFIITGSISIILAIVSTLKIKSLSLKLIFFLVIAAFLVSAWLTYIDIKNQEEMTYFQAGIAELNPKRADNAGTNSAIAFSEPGFDPITVWSENGQLKLTTVLRNSQGQIIARIDANQFRMTVSNIKYDLNFDAEALEIVNPENTVVLQVQISSDTVNVQGVFYSSGGEISIMDEYSVRVNPKDVNVNIKPIFKHPGIKYIAQRLSK